METREFALHVMCVEKYGYLHSRREEIIRIYNEWDFDGASLRAATTGRLEAMGELGAMICIAVLKLQLKVKEKWAVCIHVGTNFLTVPMITGFQVDDTTAARDSEASRASSAWAFARWTSQPTVEFQPAVFAPVTHSPHVVLSGDQRGSSGVEYGTALACNVRFRGLRKTTTEGRRQQ